MKVNREQFLAAALLFASTTGCGRLSERMKGEFNASQDPAVTETPTNNVNNGTPTSEPGTAARTGNGVPVKVAAAPVAKNAKAAPPVKAVGPAGENVAPASENIAPSKENIAPSKENIAPSSETAGPSNESWRKGRRGPASENIAPAREAVGPANENWRRRSGPASENIKPVRPPPKKA